MARIALLAVAIAASLVLSDCAAPRRSPEAELRPAAPPSATVTAEPAPPPAPAPPQSSPAPVLEPPHAAVTPASPPASNASAATPSSRPQPRPAPASGSTPTKLSAPVPTPAAPESAKAATLDLGSLEQRLKDTRAIGVFTKLSLKNQVDDLLGELRAFHNGSAKTPTAELRQKYDTLIIKVLTLLQNGDPQLASAIASSREALWGILMDPKKFAQI
jgi:hypothetical protein